MVFTNLMDIQVNGGKYTNNDAAEKAIVPTGENYDVYHYCLIMKRYGQKNMAQEATELLHQLVEQGRVPLIVPLFTSVITAWSKSFRPDTVQKAFAVLRFMEEKSVPPNLITYNAVMKCLARCDDRNAGRKAEALLSEIRQATRDSNDSTSTCLQPNDITYNLAIEACLSCGDMPRAERIMEEMNQSNDYPPTIVTYNTILNYWANQGTLAAAERAEAIVSDLIQATETAPWQATPKPDVVTYNILLKAWLRAAAGNAPANGASAAAAAAAAPRAWRVYETMVLHSKSGDVAPNDVTYNTLTPLLLHTGEEQWVERAKYLESFRSRSLPNRRTTSTG
jgi:pentatricopeptide repeat protein